MKPAPAILRFRPRAGYLLVECLVYLGVFVVVLGLATGAFFICWDHTKALHYATDDIAAALQAGERWRADVRTATGTISVTTSAAGEEIGIPHGKDRILYHFSAGEIRRQKNASGFAELILPHVKNSEVIKDARSAVTAWRWEVKLAPRRKESRLPMLFTFEAVAKNAP